MNESIENIIFLMQTDNSADAPADAIEWSKNLFKSRVVEKPSIIDRIANLVREISPDTAVAGERSGSTGTASQMMFEAGDISVDIRVSQSGVGRFAVAGQVLGTDDELVVKFAGFSSKTDELGSFQFSDVKAGTYELVLENDQERITLENITLG